MESKLITIAEYTSETDAELCRGQLVSENIDAFVFKDDCGGMRPHMQLTAGVQLKVYESDVVRAQEILGVNLGADDASGIDAEEGAEETIRRLLYRARGWILVGFAVIPGWISFPVAWVYSTKAHRIYIETHVDDRSLERTIRRLQWISAVFTLLIWGALAIWVAADTTGV